MAARTFDEPVYLDAARHGPTYLREVHRDPATGSYAWTLYNGVPEDRTNHATAWAFALLEARFWDPDAGLYRDEAAGLIWEHYDTNWEPDWDYNRDNPKHLSRPWGFQPGHQTEWAKLLLILERHAPRDWLLPTTQHLWIRRLVSHSAARRQQVQRREESGGQGRLPHHGNLSRGARCAGPLNVGLTHVRTHSHAVNAKHMK